MNPSDTPQEGSLEQFEQFVEKSIANYKDTPQTQTIRQVVASLLFPEHSLGHTLNEHGERRVNKACAAIQSLVEGVIGYEEYPDKAQDVTYDIMVRSGLRAEQRQALQTIMGTIKR